MEAIFARLDTKTLLTVVPAVCRRWREVYAQTRNVHLDFRFVPTRTPVRLHAGDELGTRMLCEISKRMVHVVGLNLSGLASLTDASVMALAEDCVHLTNVNFESCEKLTDASVTSLAEHCPHLTIVHVRGCNLTDASTTALAKHYPHLIDADFGYCSRLTDTGVVSLAEHCPHLTEIDFGGCDRAVLCELFGENYEELTDTCVTDGAGRTLPALDKRQLLFLCAVDGRGRDGAGRALSAPGKRQLCDLHSADGRERDILGRALYAPDQH